MTMSQVNFFWNGWEPIGRILIVGTLAYISIIIILRATGKRTLVSMNASDFIVTVAIGAAFGRILTARQVSIAEAATAFLLLAVLQYIVSWIEIRWSAFANLINSQPTLLFYEGRFLEKTMQKTTYSTGGSYGSGQEETAQQPFSGRSHYSRI
jgi:uncharacterized membrane protein YcaP (DUF421 family)